MASQVKGGQRLIASGANKKARRKRRAKKTTGTRNNKQRRCQLGTRWQHDGVVGEWQSGKTATWIARSHLNMYFSLFKLFLYCFWLLDSAHCGDDAAQIWWGILLNTSDSLSFNALIFNYFYELPRPSSIFLKQPIGFYRLVKAARDDYLFKRFEDKPKAKPRLQRCLSETCRCLFDCSES